MADRVPPVAPTAQEYRDVAEMLLMHGRDAREHRLLGTSHSCETAARLLAHAATLQEMIEDEAEPLCVNCGHVGSMHVGRAGEDAPCAGYATCVCPRWKLPEPNAEPDAAPDADAGQLRADLTALREAHARLLASGSEDIHRLEQEITANWRAKAEAAERERDEWRQQAEGAAICDQRHLEEAATEIRRLMREREAAERQIASVRALADRYGDDKFVVFDLGKLRALLADTLAPAPPFAVTRASGDYSRIPLPEEWRTVESGETTPEPAPAPTTPAYTREEFERDRHGAALPASRIAKGTDDAEV